MGVAKHACGLEACDGAEDAVAVVLVVCKRCGYLMPLAPTASRRSNLTEPGRVYAACRSRRSASRSSRSSARARVMISSDGP